MYSVARIIDMAFTVFTWLLIARVLLSWLPLSRPNQIVNFIYEITEPVLAPFRRIIPASPSFPIDFSPLLALLAIDLIRSLLLRILY